MTISGSVLHPAIDFISESGLRQNEIVALLGKDSTSADFSILSGTSSSHNVIELLDPRSDLRVQDRLTGLSGFSEVKVDTTFSATTGDLTPRVTAIRPLIGAVGLTVQSELLDNQANSATITYPLTNHIDLITGWKSTPVTKDVNTTSGSFNFGIRLQNRFSAGTLFPESFLGEQ
jgi:hypothetical protein